MQKTENKRKKKKESNIKKSAISIAQFSILNLEISDFESLTFLFELRVMIAAFCCHRDALFYSEMTESVIVSTTMSCLGWYEVARARDQIFSLQMTCYRFTKDAYNP